MTAGREFVAFNWRACRSGTMLGLVDIRQPSGVELYGCTVHQRGDRRWIGLPAKPQIGRDGRQLISPKTGKGSWSPTVGIPDKAIREKFFELALEAVDRLLGSGGNNA